MPQDLRWTSGGVAWLLPGLSRSVEDDRRTTTTTNFVDYAGGLPVRQLSAVAGGCTTPGNSISADIKPVNAIT